MLKEQNLLNTYILYMHGLIAGTKYANYRLFVSVNGKGNLKYFCLFWIG